MSQTLPELLEQLELTDETDRLEVKAGSELGKSARETISAFCNEPAMNGGYLVFGLRATDQGELFDERYEVVGVERPDKLQSDIASACASEFSAVVRPVIQVETLRRGRSSLAVVFAYIPEAHANEKPVFVKARGRHAGSFRRIGPTDQRCTDADFESFALTRAGLAEDLAPVTGADARAFDPTMLGRYRERLARSRPGSQALALPDEDLLEAVHAVEDGDERRPTLAGLLLFGSWKALRRHAPLHRIDYVRLPGTEWVEDPRQRGESLELLGSLFDILPRALGAVMDDIPRAFELREGEMQRRDVPRIPELAVREAIVNAVAHRDYRVHEPIQILRFANRLEIHNPGYSLKELEDLGRPGSRARNEHILQVLQETHWAEGKGTGVSAMRKEMREAGLAPPLFESSRRRNKFSIRFAFHHFLNPEDWDWLARFKAFELEENDLRALLLVREFGVVDNASYRDLNHVDTLTASLHLRRLRDCGLLKQQGRSVATYYEFGPEALRVLRDRAKPGNLDEKPTNLDGKSPNLHDKSPNLGEKPGNLDEKPGNLGEKPGNLELLPDELRRRVDKLGRRASRAQVAETIEALCRWKPLGRSELAALLGRNETYLADTFLNPMLRKNRLAPEFPRIKNHPRQRYLTVDSADGAGQDEE